MSTEQPTRLQPATAAAPAGARPTSRLRESLRWAFTPFWVVPAMWCVAAVVAGLGLPRLDRGVDNIPLLFASSADGARSLLSSIAGAMISVTGLVFSNTFVVLQLASSQFSPRILRTFLADRITQNTLGVFAATFVYSLTVLRSVRDEGGIPQIAVSFAFVLVLGAVGMFLAFIHHITSSISVDSIVVRAADQCRALMRAGERDAVDLPADRPDLPPLARQHVVTAPRSGHVDLIDRHRLCRVVGAHDARVELLHPLGTFVAEGSPLLVLHLPERRSPAEWEHQVLEAVELTRERSMRQDITFGVRRLVDIAERALSPGTNDPTTAVQVLDQMHDLLRRLAVSPDPYPVTSDDDGIPRVVTRELTFGDYLDLSLDEIAHYGRDSLQVAGRLDALLEDVAAAADSSRAAAIDAKRGLLTRIFADSPAAQLRRLS